MPAISSKAASASLAPTTPREGWPFSPLLEKEGSPLHQERWAMKLFFSWGEDLSRSQLHPSPDLKQDLFESQPGDWPLISQEKEPLKERAGDQAPSESRTPDFSFALQQHLLTPLPAAKRPAASHHLAAALHPEHNFREVSSLPGGAQSLPRARGGGKRKQSKSSLWGVWPPASRESAPIQNESGD